MNASSTAKLQSSHWPANYSAASAWWAVAVTMVFQIVSMIDRQIIAVLIPEIRTDLALNDFQISLVQGMAFALFYGAVGLVIGGLVDRYSRQKIMFAGVALWSLAASATGLARNYLHLFIGRLLVGFGEGAISPASQSLLSSIFPRSRLSTPMSCFTAAGVIGISLSYYLGGTLLDLFTRDPLRGPLEGLAPWRQVLIVTGLPGILIALLAFSIRTPTRTTSQQVTASEAGWPSFFRHLSLHRRLMAGIIIGTGLCAMATQAIMMWTPTYARRVLDVSAADVGAMMSLSVGAGGIAGGIGMGLLIDHWFSRGVRDIAFRLLTTIMLLVPPAVASAFLLQEERLLFPAMTLMMFTMGAIFGPTLAAVQMITPIQMRGRFGALAVFSSNLFGYALGPMLVGALTDYVFQDPDKVGHSIALVAIGIAPIAAWLIWSARRDFLRALDA